VSDDRAVALSRADAIELLNSGELELEGRLVEASNITLRALISQAGVQARCVYKPVRGERPLWDFPDGTLAGREYAAYLLSEAVGWAIAPPTVLRDGPLGPGMCQLWIDEDRQCPDALVSLVPRRKLPAGWLAVAAARDDSGKPYVLAHADDPRLARMAVFDVVVNNADRKGGHILSTVDSEVYGVDHGLCFNVHNKLRTVLWGWAEKPIPAEFADALRKLRADLDGKLRAALAAHLSKGELVALAARLDRLLSTQAFPVPGGGWPALPWPPL
jgi:uncharacterized repeat protein (TIGR03843 family)